MVWSGTAGGGGSGGGGGGGGGRGGGLVITAGVYYTVWDCVQFIHTTKEKKESYVVLRRRWLHNIRQAMKKF